MAHLTLAVAFLAMAALIAGAACTTTSAVPADGAVTTPDAQGDTSVDDSGSAACIAAGGQCGTAHATACFHVGPPGACGSGPVVNSFCCKGFPDAGSCAAGVDGSIQASSYDQSCTTDRDCVAIGEGDSCGLCAFRCPNAAISASAQAKYMADIATTPAGVSGQRPDECAGSCTVRIGPCCVAGKCQMNVACLNGPVGDAGACVASVGQCVFGGCSNPGPQSCGSAGMFCCLSSVPGAADAAADAALDARVADAGAE